MTPTAAQDQFARVLGPGRGPGARTGDDTGALHELRLGYFAPGLRAVDDNTAGSALIDALAAAFAVRHVPENVRTVRGALTAASLNRVDAYGEAMPAVDEDDARRDATDAVRAALHARLGDRLGTEALRGAMRELVLATVDEHGAAYLRRGGALHLQRHFTPTGWSNMRAALARRTDIAPRSGALAPLLLDAVNGAWVRVVRESPVDTSGQAAALIDAAAAAYRSGP